MSDLVKTLRRAVREGCSFYTGNPARNAFSDAADRIESLEATLIDVANIMHHGGLIGKTDSDARRLLLPYWDMAECNRLQKQENSNE